MNESFKLWSVDVGPSASDFLAASDNVCQVLPNFFHIQEAFIKTSKAIHGDDAKPLRVTSGITELISTIYLASWMDYWIGMGRAVEAKFEGRDRPLILFLPLTTAGFLNRKASRNWHDI